MPKSQACGSMLLRRAVANRVAMVAQVRPPPSLPANRLFLRVIVLCGIDGKGYCPGIAGALTLGACQALPLRRRDHTFAAAVWVPGLGEL